MKNITIAAVVAAGIALAGCVALPPVSVPIPPQPPATSTPAPPVTEPATPEPVTPAPVVAVPDEDAFMAAVATGLVIPELAPALTDTMLETGYTVCVSLDSGATREQIIALANEHLTDPQTFLPGFPTLFVDSAITYLCVL